MTTTVVVAGALANKPRNGGEAWVRMSWVAGLRRLGFDVVFLEEIDCRDCRDEQGCIAPLELSHSANYFRQVIERFGLVGSACLLRSDGAATVGLPLGDVLDRVGGAALLVNISGHLRSTTLLRAIRRRVYVDLDPCFTQVWHAQGLRGARLEGHDDFFTVGENVGTKACPVPTGGVRWLPIRQPTLIEDWTVADSPGDKFTTVASWRPPHGPVTDGGRSYGLKAHQFRLFAQLPASSPAALEIALAIDPQDAKDEAMLVETGWHVVNARSVTGTPDAFFSYVRGSKAELSCAQGAYVESNSGWFSDRTTRYLASGLPAVVQDTGFSRNLPVGEGLLAFRTVDEAKAAIESVVSEYERHRKAARALAEEEFDSDKVLGAFVEAVDVAP